MRETLTSAPLNAATIYSEHNGDGVGHLHNPTGVIEVCTWTLVFFLYFYKDFQYVLDELETFLFLSIYFRGSSTYAQKLNTITPGVVPKEDFNFYYSYYYFIF